MSRLRRWNELYRDVEARVEADLENIPAYLLALAVVTERQSRSTGHTEDVRESLGAAARLLRRAHDDLTARVGPA